MAKKNGNPPQSPFDSYGTYFGKGGIKRGIKKEFSEVTGISKMGKKIIFSGIGLLIIGFFILTKTDPGGQNWASIISPFLIVGGYITIAVGIIFPEK